MCELYATNSQLKNVMVLSERAMKQEEARMEWEKKELNKMCLSLTFHCVRGTTTQIMNRAEHNAMQ